MHPNAELLNMLFTGLDQHDHAAMAKCYRFNATFRDIAFDLHTGQQIHAMWHMICETDIRATFHVVHADDVSGRVQLSDYYTFSQTGREVHNDIESRFRFDSGLIVEHHDFCDARLWAKMALGGVSGFLAGRFRFLRALKARQLLHAFIERHPEYQLHQSSVPS